MFVPPLSDRNRWVTVAVCTKCGKVVSLLHLARYQRKGADVTWTDSRGAFKKPCLNCGHWVDPVVGDEVPSMKHLVRVTARFNDPTIWWKPTTWKLVGEWELLEQHPDQHVKDNIIHLIIPEEQDK